MMRLWVFPLLAALALGGTAGAQGVLDQLEADAATRAKDLQRVRDLLNNPDADMRVAVMEKILASGDQLIIQEARAVGLYSDDPRLRAAALKGIFDAGGNFSVEFEIPQGVKEQTDIFRWLQQRGGSWSDDRTRGYYSVRIAGYSDKFQCWHAVSNRCLFQLAGEVVALGNEFLDGRGNLVLDETGALAGDFIAYTKGSPVRIRVPLDF
jgi:hypothetical protein